MPLIALLLARCRGCRCCRVQMGAGLCVGRAVNGSELHSIAVVASEALSELDRQGGVRGSNLRSFTASAAIDQAVWVFMWSIRRAPSIARRGALTNDDR